MKIEGCVPFGEKKVREPFAGLQRIISEGLCRTMLYKTHNLSTYRNISDAITADIKDSYL